MFAQSPDLGRTWFNTWGQPVADLAADLSLDEQTPIFPTSAGVTVFSIPKYGCALHTLSLNSKLGDSALTVLTVRRGNGAVK